jgi:cell division septation protein DedD
MRFSYRAAGPVAAAVILALLAGCSRTQQDWRAAQQAGTPRAYQVFVERHPDSELAAVAHQRIAQLTEEGAWQQAARENTAAAYQEYLAKYPNGAWSQDARIRMESKSLPAQGPQSGGPGLGGADSVAAPGWPGSAPASSRSPPVSQGPAPAPRDFAPAPQVGTTRKPASAARPSVRELAGDRSTSNHYAVQLGAFSSNANAKLQWSRLSSRFGPQLRGLTPSVIPVTLSGRRLYRLEARVASQDAARRLCRQLQRQSQGCLPLP